MAERAFKLTKVSVIGAVAATVLIAFTVGSLLVVALRAQEFSALQSSDWAAIRFTISQAIMSAAISVVVAIPLARALARRQFVGRCALITLLGAPFILPVIVAVLGLLAVFGRSGIISTALGWVGMPPLSIYGFHGVVLAHVFFNLPLATRLILQGWLSIPAERFRLAASLGFEAGDITKTLEWPMLRSVLPGTFMAIFLICMTSFAVALSLGGGPGATTVELAIYQAFRFDFDLGKAALLAVVQFALTVLAAGAAFGFAIPLGMGSGLDRSLDRWDADARWLKVQDSVLLALASLFLITPVGLVFLRGLPSLLDLPPQVWTAAVTSVVVSLCSAAMAIILTVALSMWIVAIRNRVGGGIVEAIGYLAIATSPLVIGTGLFIVVYPFADPFRLALPVTVLVNAIMALPFALRVILPALRDIQNNFSQLADSLDMKGWARFRLLVVPRLRRPLGFAAGLAAALSMGDLGVIALFADPETATLPLQLYRLMAAYRMDAAAGAAVLLVTISLFLFWSFDRGGRTDADT